MSPVELRKIESSLGGNVILRGLDFKLSESIVAKFPNPYVVLLGASGCGKSTILRIIAGLQRHDSGEVLVDGRNVDQLPTRDRDIAMVFQSDSLYPHLRIRQTLMLAADRGADRSRKEANVELAIDLTRIGSIVDRFPDRLSGGELRRAAVAKAIARRAPLRLLDEPLSALDAPIRHALASDLRRWHDTEPGLTIHVTHDGDEAMRMADVIAVMDGGQIVQIASPSEIYDRPSNIAVANAVGSPPVNWIFAVLGDDDVVRHQPVIATASETIGRPVRIAIRPRHLRTIVCSEDQPDESLLIPLDPNSSSWCHVNESVHVTARVNDETLTAVIPRETFSDKTPFAFWVNRRDLHIFNVATGQRIDGGKDRQ